MIKTPVFTSSPHPAPAAHFYAIGNRQHLLEMAMVGLRSIEMEAEPDLGLEPKSLLFIKFSRVVLKDADRA